MQDLRQNKVFGSVTEDPNLALLQAAQSEVTGLKWIKLYSRDGKHRGQVATLEDLLDHLKSEIIEFEEALDKEDIDNAMEECADMSNCIDIMAMMIRGSTDESQA